MFAQKGSICRLWRRFPDGAVRWQRLARGTMFRFHADEAGSTIAAHCVYGYMRFIAYVRANVDGLVCHTTYARSSQGDTTGEWHDRRDIRHAMMETTYDDGRQTMHGDGRNSPNVRFMMYLEPCGAFPDSSTRSG